MIDVLFSRLHDLIIFILRYFLVPEIEQGLSDVAKSKVTVSFTPHLMPMVIITLGCANKVHLGIIFLLAVI